MRPLLLINGGAPTQANWATTVRTLYPESLIIDNANGLRIWHPYEAVSVWAQTPFIDGNLTVQRKLVQDLVVRHQIDRVLAVSVPATALAASLALDLPIESIVLPGELDFRFAPGPKQAEFQSGIAGADRLWLTSQTEMDKAAGHGSLVPHYLTPLFTTPSTVLTRDGESCVCVFVPGRWTAARVAEETAVISKRLSDRGVPLEVLTTELLYNRHDLDMGRGFPGTWKYRVPDTVTHVVLLGTDPHYATVATVIAARHADRLLLDATIGNAELAKRLQLPNWRVARGAALADRLCELLDGAGASEAHVSRTIVSGEQALQRLADAAREDLPSWFEEGMLDPSANEFDIFYTTAGIEDRTDGARPQRIRAMSEAMVQDLPVVRLTSNVTLMKRRLSGVEGMLDSGSRARFGYGESSTTPMSNDARNRLMTALPRIIDRGLRFAWFQRDMHWLSDESALAEMSARKLSETQDRGLVELADLSSVSKVVFAPCEASGQEYNRLLEGHGVDASYEWEPLPPGIATSHIIGSSDVRPDELLEIHYTGGFSHIYDMSLALEAIAELCVPWTLRMTVRENDLESVFKAVQGLPPEQVEITSGEFIHILPRQRRAIGLVLLDSDYGRASFPFKTVSYIEKRMPILCFDDSAIAEFVTTNAIGQTCSRSVPSIIDALTRFAEGRWEFSDSSWDLVHRTHSWEARADAVRRSLLSR